MTKPLSTAAQAVMDAWWNDSKDNRSGIAAALRAAADQVVPQMTTPWNSTLFPIISAGEVRAKFLAIAAELEQPEPEFTAEEVEMIQAPWSYLSPSQPTGEEN